MLETVRIALGRPAKSSSHVECRHCGTALSKGERECPACESSEVARYDF